jgi:hypothetical protein
LPLAVLFIPVLLVADLPVYAPAYAGLAQPGRVREQGCSRIWVAFKQGGHERVERRIARVRATAVRGGIDSRDGSAHRGKREFTICGVV